MQMRKFMTILVLAVAFVCSVATNSAEQKNPEQIRLKKDNTNTHDYPRMPAWSPVYCIVTGNEITVYCDYDTEGVITASGSKSGVIVMRQQANLLDGYSFTFDEEESVSVIVAIDGEYYSGVI